MPDQGPRRAADLLRAPPVLTSVRPLDGPPPSVDRRELPAQHWQSIRTSNPIESAFATIRHRTKRTKGCLSRDGMLHMMFKLGQCAEKNWRKLRGFAHLAPLGRLLRNRLPGNGRHPGRQFRKRHQAINPRSRRRMMNAWTPDLTIARATSRAASWTDRMTRRPGSPGQHCGFSGHASQSCLEARYRMNPSLPPLGLRGLEKFRRYVRSSLPAGHV